jgi:signal transduction histidine kinase
VDGATLRVSALHEGAAGSLWVGTVGSGLLRISAGGSERFTLREGLTGNTVQELFEDREGTVWVVTSNGLDAFRRLPVSRLSTAEGLPSDKVEAVLPARDGKVWISGSELSVWDSRLGQLAPASALTSGRRVTSLLEDHAGRIWVGLDNTLNVLQDGQLRPVAGLGGDDKSLLLRVVEDADRAVWVLLAGERRVVRRIGVDLVAEEALPAARIGDPSHLEADPRGGLWLSYRDGSLAHHRDGVLQKFPAQALSQGRIDRMQVAADGTLIAATQTGLLVHRAGLRRLLGAANGLPCERVQALVRDADSALWLKADCGFIQIAEREFERWWNAPDSKVRFLHLDRTDGALPGVASFAPAAGRSPDGRLWFANGRTVESIDPAALLQRLPAAAPRVEGLTADRASHPARAALRLAPGTRDIEIQYTAPSFAAAHKLSFQYRLDGRDQDWHDAGTRRQAFYTDLPPGAYRFYVRAGQRDGAWAEAQAPLAFEVLPAFHQTGWFRALCVAAAAAMLYGLYRVRMQQVARRVRERLEAKNAERERIARDLHDTLLQSTQGLILVLQRTVRELPEGHASRGKVDQALARADAVLTEGRDRVMDLRGSRPPAGDLLQDLARVGEELAHDGTVAFSARLEGASREIAPEVQDEAYRIGREALLNAFRHAQAQNVEVRIGLGERGFELQVLDDGCGLDEATLAQGASSGHWGLPGMRERAGMVGGRLQVRRRPQGGTEVALTVPATRAYRRALPRRRWIQRWRSTVT